MKWKALRVLLLSFIAMGLAQAPFRPARAFFACHEDKEKFCKDIPEGGGKVLQCLLGKKDQLSTACQNFLAEKKAKRNAEFQVCQADKQKFCAEVKPGEGRIRECMNQHLTELSPGCQALIQKKEKHHALKEACKAEKDKFCGNIQPGQGRIRACMQANEDRLSQTCRNAIGEMKKYKGSKPSTWDQIRSGLGNG